MQWFFLFFQLLSTGTANDNWQGFVCQVRQILKGHNERMKMDISMQLYSKPKIEMDI